MRELTRTLACTINDGRATSNPDRRRIRLLYCIFWIILCRASFSLAQDQLPDEDALPVKSTPLLTTPASPDQALVLHAGGAVRMPIPPDWHVREVGVGRQVRLLVSARPIPKTATHLEDGLWMVLEYHPDDMQPQSLVETQERIKSNLQATYGTRLKLGACRPQTWGTHQATVCDFELAPADEPNETPLRGWHAVIQTEWCRLQLHALTPEELTDRRSADVERILNQLQLSRPSRPQHMAPQVKDAQTILGSWKARTSRLRLYADGMISIATDKPFQFLTKGGQRHQGHVIKGKFRAVGDLLFIEWDDQSKLNYRWRLRGNQLLMTDHQGRMTQLARIAE